MLAIIEGCAVEPERAQDNTSPDQGKEREASGVRLSDAAIADLAQEMCIPEELFRMVIDRYPELNPVLAHRYPVSTCTP